MAKKSKKTKSVSFLWITDPWNTLDHKSDTTLRLASEAIKLGHRSYWCEPKDVSLATQVLIHATPLTLQSERLILDYAGTVDVPATRFHQIHYRVDPPVTLAYLHPVGLLHTVKSKKTQVVNPTLLLQTESEKLIQTQLGLSPKETVPTLFSARLAEIVAFARKEGEIVIKPFHAAQSIGVERLSFRTTEDAKQSEERLKARLTLTPHDTGRSSLLVVQPYLEAVAKLGEIRLWFVDGKLLTFARKKPKLGEFKIDMDEGGFLEKTNLNKAEKQVSLKLARALKRLKIRLAAIDLIAGRVSDFNFTSPGLLVQFERLLGENLARKVIQSLAKR